MPQQCGGVYTRLCHTDSSTTELTSRAPCCTSQVAALHMGICVHVHTDTDVYTMECAHRDPHPGTYRGKRKVHVHSCVCRCVGQSTCLRTHRCHPAQHNPRAILSQAWGQHGRRLPAPSRPQPLVPGLGCSAQAMFKIPQIQADSDLGDPCFLPPVPSELNLEPWGFRLQERTPTVFPGHSEWTLLMASNPEALEAGRGSYRKPTGAKNSTQGTNGLCRPASRHTHRPPPAWRGSCLPGRLGGGAWAQAPPLPPDLMGPTGGQGVWGMEIS